MRSVGHRGQCAEKIGSERHAELRRAVPICANLCHVKVVPLGSVRPSMLCKSLQCKEDFYEMLFYDVPRCSTDVLRCAEC